MVRIDPEDKSRLVDPLFTRPGLRFWITAMALLAVILWGMVMYIRQLTLGLGETGMSRPSFWGMYMVNFVFFIGISHAGTLISAILRVTGAEWRRPITRIAEAITAFALIVGTLQIIIDMGHPERLLFVIFYGRLQSPILWDVVSVTTYFLGSITYLYLPLIPDIAILRDYCPPSFLGWRRKFYTLLSFGWRGNPTQWIRLEKAISVMAVFIIPVAISVHTIISWILATTLQPGWHSTIFGPYFVVGAIFSGIGALFLAMSIARRVLKLDGYITLRQYKNLGLLFLTMNLTWFYFTYAEHLGIAAGQQTGEFPILASKLWGEFALPFWMMVGLMVFALWVMVVPKLLPKFVLRVPVFRPRYALASGSLAGLILLMLVFKWTPPANAALDLSSASPWMWTLLVLLLLGAGLGFSTWLKNHPVAVMVVAGSAVLIGMWLERWNIIVPTMTHPYLVRYASYHPTLTEISLTAASLALFVLMFIVFFKLFPAVSIWEVAEGRVIEEARSRVVIPKPEPSNEKLARSS